MSLLEFSDAFLKVFYALCRLLQYFLSTPTTTQSNP